MVMPWLCDCLQEDGEMIMVSWLFEVLVEVLEVSREPHGGEIE
jgi:hypothetical protein